MKKNGDNIHKIVATDICIVDYYIILLFRDCF